MISTWKKLVVASASFGTSFAIVLVLIVAGVSWYYSRPKPWHTNGIKASFDRIYTTGSPNHFVFDYTLENLSNRDYDVDTSTLNVFAKLQRQNSLTQTPSSELTLSPSKLFIPAKQRVRLTVNLISYGYHENNDGVDFMPDEPDNLTSDQLQAFRQKLKTYLTTTLPNLDGYRVFDPIHHYQYDLPKGW
jgi:hypothetical protein